MKITTVRLPEKLYDAAVKEAEKQEKTFSVFLREALEEKLNSVRKENEPDEMGRSTWGKGFA